MMFSRLQDHAAKIEKDMQNIEKGISLAIKTIYSVVESDSTSECFDNLVSELENINSDVCQMIKENKETNNCLSAEFDKYWIYIRDLKLQLNELEDYLEKFGFVRNENNSSSNENDSIVSNDLCDDFEKI